LSHNPYLSDNEYIGLCGSKKPFITGYTQATGGRFQTMARGQQIFALLASVADVSVDLAMAAAMPTADDDTAMKLAQKLIQRNHTQSLTALVRYYHQLAEPIRALVVSQAPQMGRVLRHMAQHGTSQDQLNVVQIVHATADSKLCYLLSDVLRYGNAEAHEDAASALLDLAHRSLYIPDEPANEDEATRAASGQIDLLQQAIEQAITFYGMHHQPAVIEAILETQPRPLMQAATVLNDLKHPATQTLMELCTTPRNPAVCESMLSLLSIPVLTEPIMQGIDFMAENHTLHQLLTQGHLLLDRRKLLRKLPASEKYFPQVQTLVGIRPRQLRHLPMWYATICRKPQQLVAQLGTLRKVSDAQTRLTTLRRLMQLSPSDLDAVNLIAGFCADSDEAIARIALRHLIRIDYVDLYHLMLRLINSPHASIRKITSERVGPVGFEKYWDSWSRFDLNQRISAGRALIKIDPSFHIQLGEKLDSDNPVNIHKAMAVIRTLNQGTFFEYALEHLTRHADPKVASTAVKTLGSAGTPRAARILESSLEHTDPRMRANAVEALDHIEHSNHFNQLMKMSKEDDNRPRANAIGALLAMNFADALTTLANMLNDERPMHRLSALWLVDHLNLRDMVRHVAELSISDRDEKVRVRAGKLIEHFINSYADGELEDEGISGMTAPSSEEATS
jgi:HEAT repeat protein